MHGRHIRTAVTAVGFGLALSLNAFTLWGISDLLSPDSAWPWAASAMGWFCLAANVTTFFICGIVGAVRGASWRRAPVAPACALLAAGGATLLAACHFNTPAVPLFQICGTLLGAGGALSFVCWEHSFSRCGTDQARAAILLATAFSTVPYLLLWFLARDAIVYPLVCILVPCCIAALVLAGRLDTDEQGHPDHSDAANTENGKERPATNAQAHRTADWKALWADMREPLACTMMIAVIGPSVSSFASLGDMSDTMRSLLYQFSSIGTAAILALCWFVFKARPTIEATFVAMVPVAVVVLFLFPFWSADYQGFVLMFDSCLFGIVSILMMMTCIELARIHNAGLGTVYGLFATGTYGAHIIGGSIADIVAGSAYPRQFQIVAIIVLLLWGLSTIAAVVLRRRGSRRTTGGAGAETPSATELAAAPASVPAAETGAPSGVAAKPEASDALLRRCEELRAQFGLSPREVEVLELIGRGRDVGAIAQILCLSRNTVRTHVQRLYADLDVHTRQELIDLLED